MSPTLNKGCLIDWLINWLIDWLIDRLIYWSIDLLIDWSIGRSVGRSVDWLIHWLIDLLIDWLIDRLISWIVWLFLNIIILGSTTKGPGCGALLTDSVVGSEIRVTSSLNSSFDEDHAVLNSSNAWCSNALNTAQYLAVILGENTRSMYLSCRT